jgi:tRNA(Ile2) C34 agmatinyltransferase TiaS
MDDEWQEIVDSKDETIERLSKRIVKLEELVIKADERLIFMSYPLCPRCGGELKPTGTKNIGFVECSKQKCRACYDKSQLMGLYISKGNAFSYLLIEKWWREVIEIIKRQNEKEVDN